MRLCWVPNSIHKRFEGTPLAEAIGKELLQNDLADEREVEQITLCLMRPRTHQFEHARKMTPNEQVSIPKVLLRQRNASQTSSC